MKLRGKVRLGRHEGAEVRPRGRWRVLPGRLGRAALRLPLRLIGRAPAPALAAGDAPPPGAGTVRAFVAPETPAVAGRNLIKRFGQGPAAVEALRGVTVTFERASFNAITGPSGSGKSTLMHLLAGLDVPSSGTVEIGGISLSDLGDVALTELRRQQVGFVFQAFNLLATLDAQENIALPLRLAGVTPDSAWMESLLRAVDLSERRDHRPDALSGGQQQRVAIARALVAKPNVVFADEPTGNLDSVSSEEVLRLLRRAVDEFGQTIVMVTHDPLVAAYADRIISIADGRIVDDKPNPDKILARDGPARR